MSLCCLIPLEMRVARALFSLSLRETRTWHHLFGQGAHLARLLVLALSHSSLMMLTMMLLRMGTRLHRTTTATIELKFM